MVNLCPKQKNSPFPGYTEEKLQEATRCASKAAKAGKNQLAPGVGRQGPAQLLGRVSADCKGIARCGSPELTH